jgi:hypothetical protein
MGGSEREKVAVTSSLRIIVTGLIAQHPWLGGVAWDYIQYVSGLARLGHDVYYFEDTGEWPYNLDGGETDEDWVAYDCTANVNYLSNIMSRFGLGDKWAYYVPTNRGGSALLTQSDVLSCNLLICSSMSLAPWCLPRIIGVCQGWFISILTPSLRTSNWPVVKRISVPG